MHETLGCAIELLIMAEEWFSKPQIFEYMGDMREQGLNRAFDLRASGRVVGSKYSLMLSAKGNTPYAYIHRI